MTRSCDKYADCDSCAFQEGHEICDACEDADQWEPADDIDDNLRGNYYGTVKIVRYPKKAKIAA